MNSSHVAAGVGGSSLTTALTVVIQYYGSLQDVGVAGALAFLLVTGVGAAGAWLRWWLAGGQGAPPPSIVNGMNGGAETPKP